MGLALLGLVFRTAGTASLKAYPRDVKTEPLSPWLQRHAGRTGFVLDRVTWLYLGATRKDITDFKSLAQLTHLRHLDLYGDGITDLAPIAGLTKLEHLGLARTPATVLSPLAGLTHLKVLDLRWSKATDFSPLSTLTELADIELEHATVADLTPLAKCRKLRYVPLSFGNNVSDAQMAALRRALPGCSVNRYSSMGDD